MQNSVPTNEEQTIDSLYQDLTETRIKLAKANRNLYPQCIEAVRYALNYDTHIDQTDSEIRFNVYSFMFMMKHSFDNIPVINEMYRDEFNRLKFGLTDEQNCSHDEYSYHACALKGLIISWMNFYRYNIDVSCDFTHYMHNLIHSLEG